jgi:hypothetical protein
MIRSNFFQVEGEGWTDSCSRQNEMSVPPVCPSNFLLPIPLTVCLSVAHRPATKSSSVMLPKIRNEDIHSYNHYQNYA